jgi:hypothetical protein
MTAEYDSALAISQMLIGNLVKTRKIEKLTKEMIGEQARLAISLVGNNDIDANKLAEDLASRFDVFVQQASFLIDDDGHQNWIENTDKSHWRFWPRCEKFLLGNLPEPVVRRIDEDTNKILNLLGNPSDNRSWDRRGLVVGDVQFGKTSNYSALACKAADAGYKIIIILAGIHESLRMQTQIRMDDAFLGFKTDYTQAVTGVGLFDPSVQAVAATARSLRGDFNKIMSSQLVLSLDAGPPMLLVVKKNAMMLRNLYSWLDKIAKMTDEKGRRSIRSSAALIIDDESDNASVDTSDQEFSAKGDPDPAHRPTRINTLIRQILNLFEKRSYVGYTATPFANIFIHHKGATATAAKDLFPKNFVVNLHAPSNYFGPIQAFGLESTDEEDASAAPLTRIIDDTDADRKELAAWIPAKHKLIHSPALNTPDGIPETLRKALLSFIIVCAVRKLRGQATQHNSMLVHVTRFTRVQALIYEQISEAMLRIKRRIKFGDEKAPNSIVDEMRELYVNDFIRTNSRMREMKFADVGQMPDWEKVALTLGDIANNIRIKQINGLAQDVLDYDSFRDQGIDVIVIGGDKLSRGLTLDGLSVSYFTRQSDMYDTLLQMGRWFGYRSGYLDLCRLYTTNALNAAFEHIALASDELRREFEFMERIGKRPIDFGLKVRSYPLLAPTALNKRRHAREIVLYVSYAGGISEAKSFSLEDDVLVHNKAALDQLVRELKLKAEPVQPVYKEHGSIARDYRSSHLWTNVDWDTVHQFLQNYRTERTATRASSPLWIAYINTQIKQTKDLKKWNVALLAGDGKAYDVAGITVQARKRERDKDIPQGSGYRIKRLVTTRDAGIDLSTEKWEDARKHDPLNRLNGMPRQEPTAFGICWARQKFNVNPLLMIYLPFATGIDSLATPVVGAAISFPGSDKPAKEAVRYTANTVLLEEMASRFDDYEDVIADSA